SPMKPLHRLLPLLAVAVPATADVITPSSATSTSTIGGSRTIAATIDGSGLSSNGGSGDILSETVGGAGNAGHWLSASSAVDDDPNFLSTTEVLTFDLGGTFDVDTVHIWPYIRAEANRGIKNFAISFSTDGGGTFPTTLASGTFSDFTIGPASGNEPVQSRSFAPQTGVTHIRMTNLTTFGSTSYIAMAEIRFAEPDTTAPSIVPPTSPADNASNVVVSENLTATFDENIALVNGGTITIRNLGPSLDADEVITIPDGRASVSGAVLTIDPASDLATGNSYAVQISSDAIDDLAQSPNSFLGITNDDDWSFQTAAESVPPMIVPPTSPAAGSPSVAVDTDLVATFDEPIVEGSGNITIKNLSDSTDTVIPVGDAQVTVSGSTLTINPSSDLDPGDNYAVQIDAGAVTDVIGNLFAGILPPDVSTWSFTTAADTTDPDIASLLPADDATNVAGSTTPSITFTEPVTAGSGITDNEIVLKNLTEGTQDSYAPTAPEITIVGDTLTIDRGADLDAGDSYAIQIGANALEDLSGNPFAGINDDTTWNFTIVASSVVITPSVATTAFNIGGSRSLDKTIDSSGLSGGGISGDILSETHTNNSSGDAYWLSNSTGGNVDDIVLTYELAAASDVNEIHLWGYYRGGTSRSIQNFDLSFSTDGGATFPTTISKATLGNFVGPADPIAVQTKAFALQAGVTHIRMSNFTNFGDSNYLGLSEIRFGGPPTTPVADPFADWIAGFDFSSFDSPDLTGAGNPEGDTLSNLLEFAFGTDPTLIDAVALNPDGSVNGVPVPVASGGGGGVTFDYLFVRRDDHGTSGSVTYTPQFSSDLTTFYDSSATPDLVADSTDDPAYEIVKVPYPAILPDGKKARFARMKVDEVP
ncbi:MAG: Ig-like domain-containing protein, partial [Haloferula sp.]